MTSEPYHPLVDAVDEGLFHLDPQGCFVAVNEAFTEATGYPRHRLEGAHASLVFDEASIDHLERTLHGDDTGPARINVTFKTEQGSLQEADVKITPTREDGSAQGVVGILGNLKPASRPKASPSSTDGGFRSVADVLDQAHVGAIVLDASFDVVWADASVEAFLGVDRDEVIGQRKPVLLTEVKGRFEDPDRFERLLERAYDENSSIARFEAHVLPDEKEGRKERWLEHWSKPIDEGPYEGGRLELYYDVTDKRRHQDALWESQTEFASLVDAVEDYAIFRLSPTGHIASWNEGARKLKGYEPGEIIGDHVSTFYTEEDKQAGRPERNLKQASGQGSIEDEGWRVRKDGSLFWANVTITALEDAEGAPMGFLKVTRDMTERREREQAIQEERDVVNRMIETTPVGIILAHPDGTLEKANEHMASILGVPLEDVNAYELGELDAYDAQGHLVPPEERPPFQALRTGEPASSVEYRIENAKGQTRWLNVNAAPVLTDDGQVRHVVVAATDVSQLKTQAKRLERQRDELRTELDEMFERIGDAFYAVDENERFTYVNDAFANLTDTPKSELTGASVWEILPELEETPFGERARGAKAHEERIEHEFYYEPADAWLKASIYPSSTGQSVYLEDITERKQTQERLESRAIQQETVARLGRFALAHDLDELMHECAKSVADALNNTYCKVLDLDPHAEELLLRQGVGWKEGIVGNASVKSNTRSQAGYTLLSKEPVVVNDLDNETRFTGPDLLTSHEVKSGISTIIGPYHEPWGILGTHDTRNRDYTAEDVNFVQSVANILAEAIERNAYETDLEDTISRLEESNKRLEHFAYAASHDMQEPLRMVSSYLRLLKTRYHEDLDTDGQEFIEFAVNGADRMRGMIQGLLAYSRIDTQGEPQEPVDAGRILDDVLDDLEMKIQETHADITTDDLPRVLADPNQLRQLFQNLIKNALKYAGDEPPRVHVQATRDGARWRISVADEGIGIHPDDTQDIFEIFQRAHPREQASGSGIGLAICQRIVERHGGEIWVDSQPGQGSTFHFTLAPAEAHHDPT